MPVIGYDCNGKPLHPGDRCVLLEADPEEPTLKAGTVVTISAKYDESSVILDAEFDKWAMVAVHTSILRKLPKDQHRSADRSFEDLMRGIKTLMPEEKCL